MQSEQAAFLLNYFQPQLVQESAITRKVIAAIPEDGREWRPDSQSRSAMELAWHIVSGDIWFLEGMLNGQFSTEEPKMPAQIKTVADVLDWYDRNVPGLQEKLKTVSGEHLARVIPFFDGSNQPLAALLAPMLAHTVHHRGQLAAYLRPMGAKVPSIYGGSADEPFQSPV